MKTRKVNPDNRRNPGRWSAARRERQENKMKKYYVVDEVSMVEISCSFLRDVDRSNSLVVYAKSEEKARELANAFYCNKADTKKVDCPIHDWHVAVSTKKKYARR